MAANDKIKKRLDDLAKTATDVSLAADFHEKILRLVSLWLKNFDELDQGLLDISREEIVTLERLLSQAHRENGWVSLSLSQLAFFQLEKISLCAEAEFDTMGGKNAIGMSLQQLTALTNEIGEARRKTFPAAGAA